jgi:predicted ATP-grasp superfamily ATP-dependent carboligase
LSPDDPVPALILGSGLTALGVTRILGRAGIPAYGDGHAPELERHSRWYRSAPSVTSPDDFTAWLNALPFERAVLIPCSDQWTSRVAQLPPELRERFPASVPAPDTIEQLVDKAKFAAALAAAGVDHPRTTPLPLNLANLDNLAHLDNELFAGAFLKPCDSQAFFARFKVKGLRVGSRDEAARHLAAIAPTGLAMILQEYVPGPSDRHYLVDGYVDRSGEVRVVFARRRLRMYPPDFGNSSCMVSVPLDQVAGAVSGTVRLLRHLGYRGIFSAEFKQDERDGVFRMLEVNARPWWYVEFAARCGADVVGPAYRDALGLPVTTTEHYEVGRYMVYPYYDRYAALAAWRAGRLSVGDWARSWLRGYQPVFVWDDPFPAWEVSLATLGRWLGRRFGRRETGDGTGTSG